MASQPYNFSTGDFDAFERGVLGAGYGSGARYPILQVEMGGALFRALYEYGHAGLTAGELSASPQFPDVNLAAVPSGVRYTIAPVLTATSAAIDTTATASAEWLTASRDTERVSVVVFDTGYTAGTICAPTLKAWCEALGGTYWSEL